MTHLPLMHKPLGCQRDWVWRGWQIRYAYLRAGVGADPQTTMPLCLLHGFGSSLTQWQTNLLPLSQFHTVYALDLLGFGASEKAPTLYNIPFWAEQVYDFWRAFIRQPMVLIGHSLGAVVGLAAAIAHPEMIKSLVLLTLPPARQELLSGGIQTVALAIERLFTHPLLLKPVFNLFRQPFVLRTVLRAAYANPEYVTEALISSFVAPALDHGADEVFVRLAKARTDTHYSPEIKMLVPQIQKSILVLWGQQDRVVPLSQGKDLPLLNPLLKLVEIPNAGHCLYDECADRVNQEILQWVAQ
jgi:pimeloyl-ACP methyl ester carboxylesterase